MSSTRIHPRWRALALLALFTVTGTATAQVPGAVPADQRRARLEYLQGEERALLDLLAYWRGLVADGEMFLLPADADIPFGQGRKMPRPVSRPAAADLAQRMHGVFVVTGLNPRPTVIELLDEIEQQSNVTKGVVRTYFLPRWEQDLERVRDEFRQLMAQRDAPGQSPRTWPGGRAWYFRRAVVGTDRPSPDFELLAEDVGEQGGMVRVRGRIERSACFETWEYRWRFGTPITRLAEGMEIPVTLQVALTSAACPSANPSFIALGGGREESVLMRDAPSPVLQGAMTFGTERAAATGVSQHGMATSVIRVTANPGQSNAWTHFRLQLYMPGHFWVVGYLYLAGGG